jgi:preprotein translocase subunit SecE
MSRIFNYLNEVFVELRKANWPWNAREKGFAKYKELTDSTVVVFVAMILLGAFVSGFDTVLRYAFQGVIELAASTK